MAKKNAFPRTRSTPQSPVHKRTPAQREKDMADTMRLLLQGKQLAEIAAIIGKQYPGGLSVRQIGLDVQTMRKRYLESSLADTHTIRSRELMKLDLIEREAWEQWERSKLDVVETSSEKVDALITRSKAAVKKKGQTGNTRYLQVILECIDRRTKMCGLNVPETVNVNTHGVVTHQITTTPYDAMDTDELLSTIHQKQAMLQGIRALEAPLVLDGDFTID